MIDVIVDLYHGESPIDFEEMQASGIIGVIHKASEGTTVTDSRYAERREIASDLGLLWGAYHFLRPGDMRVQAAHFVDCAGRDVDIYAADHEDDRVSLEALKLFLREVTRLTGKQQLVIYSGHVLKEQLGSRHDAELAKHRLWLAHYTSGTPTWPTGTWPTWWLHQYTESGHVAGYDGEIDRNKYAGTKEQLFADWTGTPPEPEPVPPDEPVAKITIEIVGVSPENIQVSIK